MAPSADSGIAAAWPGVAAALGAILLLVGLILPVTGNSSGTVTEQQAQEYYEAHSALEQAAANKGQARNGKQVSGSPSSAEQLEIARKRFEEAKADVESTKTGRARLAWWLKISGVVLAIVGAGGLLTQRS
jgi:hypothetical protein